MIGICFINSLAYLEYIETANKSQEIFRKYYAKINIIKKARTEVVKKW